MEPLSATNRFVRLFDRGEDRIRLVKILNQLNFTVTGESLRREARFDEASAVAAIVSDQIEAPLGVCAALNGHCPVILVSDETSFAFRLKAMRAGVEAILRRPVNAIELSEWLEVFVDRKAQGPVSVLVVDDDPLVAELCVEILGRAGMAASAVVDPEAALLAIEATLPDLVLMDLLMPGVGGVELARIIRQSRRFAALPIVFLSGEQDEGRQMEARALGGDDFIVKPVDPQRLIAIVSLRAGRSRVLRTLIERDSLTGLYDHGRFKDQLARELERCRRFGGMLSLAMLDIDRFKSVNDTFGHPVGDTVIRALSSVLCAGLRKIDIVGRYGGEEFGIILLDTEPRGASIVLEKLRARFQAIAFEAEGRVFSVSFSAGIASSRHHGTLPELIGATDAALYRAKQAGRNIVLQADAPQPHGPAAERST